MEKFSRVDLLRWAILISILYGVVGQFFDVTKIKRDIGLMRAAKDNLFIDHTGIASFSKLLLKENEKLFVSASPLPVLALLVNGGDEVDLEVIKDSRDIHLHDNRDSAWFMYLKNVSRKFRIRENGYEIFGITQFDFSKNKHIESVSLACADEEYSRIGAIEISRKNHDLYKIISCGTSGKMKVFYAAGVLRIEKERQEDGAGYVFLTKLKMPIEGNGRVVTRINNHGIEVELDELPPIRSGFVISELREFGQLATLKVKSAIK